MTTNGKAQERKRVNIALQGGGSHGAFTWGVLDRLLEDGRLELAAISGTSAGAMNAVALADGWRSRRRRRGAREAFGILESGRPQGPLQSGAALSLGHAARATGRSTTRQAICGSTPCRGCSRRMWPTRSTTIRCARWWNRKSDFDNVRSRDAIKLFISTTNVETGKLRVFGSEEINVDVVMASACLPHIFQAVTIDGVPYWDGGYGGNPAIYPFYYANEVEDVLLVQVNPVMREGTPHSVATRSRTASTRSPSTPRCSANSGRSASSGN